VADKVDVTDFHTWSRKIWGQWPGSFWIVQDRSSADRSSPSSSSSTTTPTTPGDSCSWTGSTAGCYINTRRNNSFQFTQYSAISTQKDKQKCLH